MGTYYKRVEQYLDKIDTGAWVEIGVDRGEGSTRWFALHAKKQATKFYAVDMDADQIARASVSMQQTGEMIMLVDGSFAPVMGEPLEHVEFYTGRGEDFLDEYLDNTPDQPISLAYLDNFDWDYWLGMQEEAFVAGVKQRYIDKLNVEMTNINSQHTHLLQAMKLIPLLTENSIVICDDTWYMPNEGIFSGKCSAVIPFLQLHGFKVLDTEGYRQNSGVIMGRFTE